ncbi:ShlB/FhaC/HecB family hemolysin secretion/activation protein [Paraglaciecola sp.]|uniref:ShlB/FhaC/HecB family hemolysin secretion/activation protein n=1 Tax=Paraglaciecola sp. TaxID=1920173 RepID=UPI00273F291A|nr:ShlB/FhaC/HecB family hemolysin secretion/activation protein [Paraglaciecola sp.]MDP5031778.1 ShlB/FhaC/HecB family hemolysin secretion/activation protein [Paraglaciecola sp.]
MLKRHPLVAALIGLGLSLPTLAIAALPAVAPDAGRLTRELQQPVEAPRPGVSITLPTPGSDVVQPGGPQITLNAVAFSGNTGFSQQQLIQVIQPALGKPHDLAGLYQLADQISMFYRSKGYSFAKAFVPENGFQNGTLTITVVEGRYGRVTAEADSPARSAQAQRFLSPLKTNTPIYAAALERQILILDDQPGYDVLPIIKPGQMVGTGDLHVKLTRQPLIRGSVSLNNHGNRYTGYVQARANVQVNSPLMVGDQLSVSLLTSDKDLRSGSLNYSLPLGANGLRATAGYSYTEYRLAREFANLQATGEAQTTSLGLSYPLLRSRNTNVNLSVQGQHKRFFDEQRSVNARQSRASDSGVAQLSFDRLDQYGISYGQVEWTMGRIKTGQPDLGRVNGSYSRLNADLVRLQRLSNTLSLYARMNGQKARRNLDSSESYSLGGPFAVRAYPTGEGTGDEGAFGQVELRLRMTENVSPFLFYDGGRVRTEQNPIAVGKNNRTLSGAGIGVRYQAGRFNLESIIARRLVGGDPESDPRDGQYTGWLSVGYAF